MSRSDLGGTYAFPIEKWKKICSIVFVAGILLGFVCGWFVCYQWMNKHILPESLNTGIKAGISLMPPSTLAALLYWVWSKISKTLQRNKN